VHHQDENFISNRTRKGLRNIFEPGIVAIGICFGAARLSSIAVVVEEHASIGVLVGGFYLAE
jgi:hypothetical protein